MIGFVPPKSNIIQLMFQHENMVFPLGVQTWNGLNSDPSPDIPPNSRFSIMLTNYLGPLAPHLDPFGTSNGCSAHFSPPEKC